MSELRQKKFARTRLALATVLSNALMVQPLSEISVKALCREAEVSEATFFNYFPGKQNLMGYLAQLWLLELGWQAAAANTLIKIMSRTPSFISICPSSSPFLRVANI